jgi:hypothetical protein
MSTATVAIILAGVGILCVIGVSYAFYLVGRAEDRDRAEAEKRAEPKPEPKPGPPPDHGHTNGRIARERRRPMPPRRP